MSTAAQTKIGALPTGELLGRFRSYEDAQKIVDHLAAAEDFDIKTVTIVGNDVRLVERIRSRLSYPRVAGAGAAQGAMFGFFIGLMVWLFAPGAPVVNMLLSVLLGMLIWTLFAVVSYAIRRGQRDFASSSQMVASTFDVVCDFSVAGRARQLVANSGVISLNAWNDPTGRSANLAGPTSAAAPAGGQSGGQQAGSHQSGPREGHDDLPGGRPRYGVRIEQSQHSDGDAAAAEPTAVPHDEPQQAGDAPGAGDDQTGDDAGNGPQAEQPQDAAEPGEDDPDPHSTPAQPDASPEGGDTGSGQDRS